MRFDLSAFRELFSARSLYGFETPAAACGAMIAAGAVLYAAWPVEPSAKELPAEAVDVVVAAKPMFRPVPATASGPLPEAEPAAPENEFADATSLSRSIQAYLKRAGCYSGRVDGRWSPATMRAMAAFAEIVNARLPVDHPDPVLLALLETHHRATCDPQRRPGPREETASIGEDRAGERKSREPEQSPSAAGEQDLAAAAIPDSEAAASAAAAEEAAAIAAAATATQVSKADRPRYKRKYRGPSISRGFRKFRRTVRAIFF